MLKYLYHRIRRVLRSYNSGSTYRNSFSQAGEDMILSFLFADKGIVRLNYLDIGANYPDVDNNTYYFYLRGNKGVCVDADRSLTQIIRKKRPNDMVVHAGVSIDKAVEADFYIFDVKGLNTFDRLEATNRAASGRFKIMAVDRVPLMSINAIISKYFETYPELLSLDIEGLDLSVLKSLDFNRYPIPVICTETCIFSENHIRPKDNSISEFMISRGYEVYADTYVNTIFVNKKWFQAR